jgi:ABC-type phosphate/phosphonate transport system substrate-binding protein
MDKKTKKKLKDAFNKFSEETKKLYIKADVAVGKLRENQNANSEEIRKGMRIFE